jgi:hypothetical protein
VNPIAPALERLSAEIAALTGGRVDVPALGITDRAGHLPLAEPGLRSPNGACRLVRAADRWIAVNLAREEDRQLVPAWLGCEWGAEPWAAISAIAPLRPARDLAADAAELGLPVGLVGEVSARTPDAPTLPLGAGSARDRTSRVVDLSALWAGPLCGAIMAEAGADVVKVESLRRPDPTREHTPELFRRLNGKKTELRLDLSSAVGRARLLAQVAAADVLITSARRRGLASLGLDPHRMAQANPGLIWVAISGYGWEDARDRAAFGDDAAAAGGLVRWSDGVPQFLGDALADPVTGLAAAAGALRALTERRSCVVDAGLAVCAAGAASLCDLEAAA